MPEVTCVHAYMLEGDPQKGKEGRRALGICSDVVEKYVQELLPTHRIVICCFFLFSSWGESPVQT